MFKTRSRMLIIFFFLVLALTLSSCADSDNSLPQESLQFSSAESASSDNIDISPSVTEIIEADSALSEEIPEQAELLSDEQTPISVDSEDPSEDEIVAEYIDPSFFDDAVFFGDSVSAVLQYNALNENSLGKAQFYVQTSYSVNAAANNLQMPRYRGRQMTPQNILRTVGAKKVFIMLGNNDPINHASVEKTMANWAKLIANIREYVPDIRIFIQSCTPMYSSRQLDRRNNALIDEYNNRLREFCLENDCTYVSIGEHFKDADGGLIDSYSRDQWIHLNFDGGALWAELLKDPSNYSVPPI